MHKISVVIPARNDAQTLAAAVQACLDQEFAQVDDIVIAVGPSTDTTAEVAESLARMHDRVSVVHNPQGTTPVALNLAIDSARGDIVVRVDARSLLPRNYVANAIETMGVTGAANVGAIQHPVGTTSAQRSIAAAMRSRLGSGGAAYRGTADLQRVDTAYLGVFRRSALEDVGGFDESFIRNQDAELNLRLSRAGHEVWVDPRMVVDYGPRSSLTALAKQYWQYGWWRRLTGRKHPGSLGPRQLATPALLLLLVASAIVAIWFTPALLVGAAYVACVIAVGMGTRDLSLVERFYMAAALVVMHCSWAAGFLASSSRLVLVNA